MIFYINYIKLVLISISPSTIPREIPTLIAEDYGILCTFIQENTEALDFCVRGQGFHHYHVDFSIDVPYREPFWLGSTKYSTCIDLQLETFQVY